MITKETQSIIEGFSSYLSNKGRKASTIKRYIYDVESFSQWLHQSKKFTNDNIWESLQKKDFESFFNYLKADRQYSDKTLYRIYVNVKIKMHIFACLSVYKFNYFLY
ncbi:hypothetical protein COD67_00945 [Bacillus cereus]|nr:hypothetical protein COI89_19080 [Bacillus cereus]PGU71022.1 hypothetical protein COD67_00945 [Bacillus cereus]